MSEYTDSELSQKICDELNNHLPVNAVLKDNGPSFYIDTMEGEPSIESITIDEHDTTSNIFNIQKVGGSSISDGVLNINRNVTDGAHYFYIDLNDNYVNTNYTYNQYMTNFIKKIFKKIFTNTGPQPIENNKFNIHTKFIKKKILKDTINANLYSFGNLNKNNIFYVICDHRELYKNTHSSSFVPCRQERVAHISHILSVNHCIAATTKYVHHHCFFLASMIAAFKR